ncbi:hypothetical protein [Micromonospora sp. IBHARD004]|uniref:hypothetical protein n=1 Tax=Micromonospora sp. IBHARD004 TaxID=3457764 RepID=UPI004058B1D2
MLLHVALGSHTGCAMFATPHLLPNGANQPLPVVALGERGYHLPTLGALTVATLRGLIDR